MTGSVRVIRLNGRLGVVKVGAHDLNFHEVGPRGAVAEFSGSDARCKALIADIEGRKGYEIEAPIADAPAAPPEIKAPTPEPAPAPQLPPWKIAQNNGWSRDDMTGNLAFWVGGEPSTVSGLSIDDMAATPPPEGWAEARGGAYAWEVDGFRPPRSDWRPSPGLRPRRAVAAEKPDDSAPDAPPASGDTYAGDTTILAEVVRGILDDGGSPGRNKVNSLLRKRGQPPVSDEQISNFLLEVKN